MSLSPRQPPLAPAAGLPDAGDSTVLVAGWLRLYLPQLLPRADLGILCAGQGLRLDQLASPLLSLPDTAEVLVDHLMQRGEVRRFAAALLRTAEELPQSAEQGEALIGLSRMLDGPGGVVWSSRSGTKLNLVRAPQICHRLLRTQSFAGRADQLATLDWAWQEGARVMALTAPSGCGKTALLQHWLDGRGLSDPRRWRDFGVEGLFIWSFASDGDVTTFLRAAADYVEGRQQQPGSVMTPGAAAPEVRDDPWRDLQRLLGALERSQGHVLLVLDGMERFQVAPYREVVVPGTTAPEPSDRPGEIADPHLRALLIEMAAVDGEAALLCTLERDVPALQPWHGSGYVAVRVPPLSLQDGVVLLRQSGATRGSEADAERRCAEHHGHALTLDLLGRYLGAYYHGSAQAVVVSDLPPSEHARVPDAPTLRRVLRAQVEALGETQRGLLDLCVILPGPLRVTSLASLGQVAQDHLAQGGPLAVEGLLQPLRGLDLAALSSRLSELSRLGLIHVFGELDETSIDVHPLLRRLLYESWFQARTGRAVAPDGAVHGDLLPRQQDAVVLDLLEQLVLVALEGGLISESYELLTARMGGYAHLGRALGEYRRLLTVLRILSPVLATVAEGSPLWARRAARVVLWEAETLRDLGQVGETLSRHQSASPARPWHVDAYLASGMLRQAAVAATDVFFAAGGTSARVVAALQQARVLRLLGDVGLSRVYLLEAELTLREQPEAASEVDGRPLREIIDHERLELALLLGDLETARLLLGRCQHAALRDGRGKDLALLDIMSGEIARRDRDQLEAAQSIHRALAWGARTGDAEVLVRAGLSHALIRMDAGNLDGAASAIGIALPTAGETRLGLLSIDLLLVRAQLLLRRGDLPAAEEDARDALAFAMAPDCAYAWGEAEALHLLAMVLLANRSGARVSEAADHLQDEIALRQQMGDPRAQDVRWLLQRLSG